MKKLLVLFLLASLCATSFGQTKKKYLRDSVFIDPKVDTRIDNNAYWRKMMELGLVKVIRRVNIPRVTKYIGSEINAKMVSTTDSHDIQIGADFLTQSENSVFIDPTDNDIKTVVISVNTNFCFADVNVSNNFGFDWLNYNCEDEEVLPTNDGDPSTVISNAGVRYFGYITVDNGQGVSFTQDGVNYVDSHVASPPGGDEAILDKNHLWIDNSLTSPHHGNLYDAWWYNAGSGSVQDPKHGEIQFYYSGDGGVNWGPAKDEYDDETGIISKFGDAGSHNQGVNIQTGPDGEVYAVWAIYDFWPKDGSKGQENAFGFNSSVDGGENWDIAKRIIENDEGNYIEGIRGRKAGVSFEVNSWPSMTVDNSKGLYRGTIYVVFALKEENNSPNTEDYRINIYLMKSEDKGEYWSEPSQINTNFSPSPPVYEQAFFPWIVCDPETGILSVVFYKAPYGGGEIETRVANSDDGGETWEEFIISDKSFVPVPLNGYRNYYFGDYLGIAARCGKVYPTWTANANPDAAEGSAESYVSPYQIGGTDLELDGIIAESKIYFATNSIVASPQSFFIVGEGARTEFNAGNMIHLKPGFHAVQGSVFSAFNCNCGNEVLPKDAFASNMQFDNAKEVVRLIKENNDVQNS